MKSTKEHWDSIFSKTRDSDLGWYEKDAAPTLRLLGHISGWKKSTVFIPGAGTSVLVDELLSRGAKLILNDISIKALSRVKDRLGKQYEDTRWICRDIAQPIHNRPPVADIWLDRAVLHFFTEEDDINGYFNNLRSILKVGGHAVFAEFSKNGARKCAGLILHRYSLEELSERLGTSFKTVACFDHTYINPNGDPRPYIYALFRREAGGHYNE